MDLRSLEGRSILIVEDEPLIVLDMTAALEHTGLAMTTTNTLKHALLLVEDDGLAGAILDHALGDDNSTVLCLRLAERNIPYLIYSGLSSIDGPCADAPRLGKPAQDSDLVAAVKNLIYGPLVSAPH